MNAVQTIRKKTKNKHKTKYHRYSPTTGKMIKQQEGIKMKRVGQKTNKALWNG